MTPAHHDPPAESRDWVLNAACRGTDPKLFEPENPHQTEAAIRICNGCLALAACLRAALLEEDVEFGGPWHIRGGMTATQRANLTPRQRADLTRNTKEH